MHREQQPLRVADGRQARRELIRQPCEIRAPGPIGSDRPRCTHGSRLSARFLEHRDEATHFGQLSAMPVERRLAEDRCKVLVPRCNRRESIAFLHDGGNRDGHSAGKHPPPGVLTIMFVYTGLVKRKD